VSMQFNKSFKKGCHIFVAHMEETIRDKVSSIEDHLVLKYFEDVLGEIQGFPPKSDIYFSIHLVLGSAPVSKTRYRIGKLELKRLQM
jgi:hypothetical protein